MLSNFLMRGTLAHKGILSPFHQWEGQRKKGE